MLFVTTVVKLLSPLRLMLGGNHATSTHNLTELLATDAITASLNPLVGIQTDLSKFAEGMKIRFTKHFPADYINTPDRDHQYSMAELKDHQNALLKYFDTVLDPDLSHCVFDPQTMDLCKESVPRPGSFRAVVEAEALRTRKCAGSFIIPAYRSMILLQRNWIEDTHAHYTLNLGPYIAKSVQDYEFRRRFLGYWDDLLELKISMSKSWTLERYDYLQFLEAAYVEAAKNSLVAISLDGSVLLDDWHAIHTYWTTLCHELRCTLLDVDNSTASILAMATPESKEGQIGSGLGGLVEGWQ